MKILTNYIIEKIDEYLAIANHGEVIIIRHDDQLIIDVKDRDRKLKCNIKVN